MTPTLRFGRVGGIPVGAHWSALVIVVLVAQVLAVSVLPAAAPGQSGLAYWLTGLGGAVLFVAGLLVHELAHAVLARHYGMRVERITLWGLGGVAELADEPPTPRADLVVAVAGPLTSATLAAFFLAAGSVAAAVRAPGGYVAALTWLALMNLLLAVFNLLPGAPLDGGRVLRAVLWWRHGDRASARASAAQAGVALGLLLITAGAVLILATGTFSGLWLALIGWFLRSAATAEGAAGEAHDRLARVLVRDVMTADVAVVPAWSTVADLVDIAAQRRQRVFPVIDLDGQASAVVTLAQLAAIPPGDRSRVRVDEVAEPLTRLPIVAPDAALADVVAAAHGGFRGGGAVVVDHGHVVGLLTADDVARALELARLGGAVGTAPLFPRGG